MSTAPKTPRARQRADSRDVEYYDEHATSYAAATLDVDLSAIRSRFLRHVRPKGLILDVGSGSGRDTLAFLRLGYSVEAIEPSAALAAISVKLTGVRPRNIRAQELTDDNRYDAIWACASLVHVPSHVLEDVFHRLSRAARDEAPIYVSFKHGHGSRVALDGRPYTDLNEADLHQLLGKLPHLQLAECWRSFGPEFSPGERDAWLNAVLINRRGKTSP
jgi:SAM-dependent methyltransferase